MNIIISYYNEDVSMIFLYSHIFNNSLKKIFIILSPKTGMISELNNSDIIPV